MKIRAIGTGSRFCRHPLVAASFLIQSGTSNIVVGCGPGTPAKLESIGVPLSSVDMWLLLSTDIDQIGGLFEVANRSSERQPPFLVAPGSVISGVMRVFSDISPAPVEECFDVRPVLSVRIEEDHSRETAVFVPNTDPARPASFGLYLEESGIYLSGNTAPNDERLEKYGRGANLILHACSTETRPTTQATSIDELLASLPDWAQKKTWLYGYDNNYLELCDPLPMLFLPQGTHILDSSRKDKLIEKERFIREQGKRIVGNRKAAAAAHMKNNAIS